MRSDDGGSNHLSSTDVSLLSLCFCCYFRGICYCHAERFFSFGGAFCQYHPRKDSRAEPAASTVPGKDSRTEPARGGEAEGLLSTPSTPSTAALCAGTAPASCLPTRSCASEEVTI